MQLPIPMKWWVLTGIGSVALIAAACSSGSPTPTPSPVPPTPTADLAALVQRQFDAIGRGDVNTVIAIFTDDAVLEGAGLCGGRIRPTGCTTKADIQKEMEREAADHTNLTLTSRQVSGNTVRGRVEVRFDGVKVCPGVERIAQSFTAEARGDKIAALRAQVDTTDQQTTAFLGCVQRAGILRQHYDSVNRGDAAGTLALLADDASIARGGCPIQTPCVGTAAIQLQLDRDKIGQFRYTVLSLQASGDTVTGQVEFRNVNVKNSGLERVIEKVTATFKGDKIAQLVHELDLSDPQSAAFANFRRVAGIPDTFVDPLNLGNVAGALAALTEDAVFEGYGLCAAVPCTGKAAIQKELERLVADNTKTMNIGGTTRVTGDSVMQRREIRSDSIKAAGVDRIIVAVTVDTKGNKITSLHWVPDTTDAQTATYQKVALVRQHYEAGNQGNVAASAAVFTDDAVMIGRGGCTPQTPCTGKAEIQTQIQNFVTGQDRNTVLSVQVSGNTVTARIEGRSTAISGAGIERTLANATITFTGDKISRLVHELDASDAQTQVWINFRRIVGIITPQTLGINRGDAVLAMSPFADDAVFEGFGLCAAAPCVGKAAIQKETEREIADKTNLTNLIAFSRVSGDTFTGRLEIRSDSIKAAGVERVIAARTVETKGGKIVAFRYVLDQSDAQTATYLKSVGR